MIQSYICAHRPTAFIKVYTQITVCKLAVLRNLIFFYWIHPSIHLVLSCPISSCWDKNNIYLYLNLLPLKNILLLDMVLIWLDFAYLQRKQNEIVNFSRKKIKSWSTNRHTYLFRLSLCVYLSILFITLVAKRSFK